MSGLVMSVGRCCKSLVDIRVFISSIPPGELVKVP